MWLVANYLELLLVDNDKKQNEPLQLHNQTSLVDGILCLLNSKKTLFCIYVELRTVLFSSPP